MSLKVEVVAKQAPEKKAKFPRLMLHTPTGSVVLQYNEHDAIKMTDGSSAPDWSKKAGPMWLMTSKENYIPWVGALTLEND